MFKIKESGKFSDDILSMGIYTKEDNSSNYNIAYFHLLGRYWYIQTPRIIKPKAVKKTVTNNIYTFAEGGYIEYTIRHYGFSFGSEGFHMYYGLQPGCWIANDPANSNRSFYWDYPWKYFYQCKYEILDVTNGNVTYCSENQNSKLGLINPDIDAEKSAPKIIFSFKDAYDDAPITATCSLGRRTFRVAYKKAKIWSFLQWFIKDKVSTTLWCDFDSELGSGKGSWKGGITGMGATVESGESLLDAFKRKIEGGGYGCDVELIGYM